MKKGIHPEYQTVVSRHRRHVAFLPAPRRPATRHSVERWATYPLIRVTSPPPAPVVAGSATNLHRPAVASTVPSGTTGRLAAEMSTRMSGYVRPSLH